MAGSPRCPDKRCTKHEHQDGERVSKSCTGIGVLPVKPRAHFKKPCVGLDCASVVSFLSPIGIWPSFPLFPEANPTARGKFQCDCSRGRELPATRENLRTSRCFGAGPLISVRKSFCLFSPPTPFLLFPNPIMHKKIGLPKTLFTALGEEGEHC